MAEEKSSGVQAAYRVLMGVQAEAGAFAELLDGPHPDVGVCWDILLGGCLRRMVEAVDQFEHQLIKSGVDLLGVRDV